ncbi:MAG: LD-carboxypeptidase [Williamsia sp.]|nr:LD-carboxypeptidase [Williamsia sp.]
MATIPPYLKKGDTIGIVCPAGYMPLEKAQTCIDTLREWGYEVKVGATLGSNSTNYFSGTDAERLADLQQMLDDKHIKAILCGRGGYGTGRIVEQIDFTQFKKHPKWIIGFSDITVLHIHLWSNFSLSSLHAPMAAAFNGGEASNEWIASLRKALAGEKALYQCAPHPFNNSGKTSGRLIGGNLCLLAHLIGTSSDYKTKGKILFMEDVGEYLYSADRLLYQLKRNGKLSHLAGLIIGGFTDSKDTERPFGKSAYEMIHDLVKEYNYPICFDFPVSHNKENYALKIGVKYSLQVGKEGTVLKELSGTLIVWMGGIRRIVLG